MITPCPHCQAEIEIDTDTHAALLGQSHFACPACQGAVVVPVTVKPRLQMPTAPAIRARRPGAKPRSFTATGHAHKGQNLNLLILGAVALLVLGGIGFFLASQKSGDTNTVVQNIRNEILNNSYFQNMIATGVTTEKDLLAITDIRPYEDGFIGISKEVLNWEQAGALAEKTGSHVLSLDDVESAPREQVVVWLESTFSSHISSPIWVREGDDARILDGPEVLAVTALDRQRKVFLHWSAGGEIGFVSLFNGRDLSGWNGDPRFWSVRDGAIHGESPPGGKVPKNTFLIWQNGTVGDFEMKLSARILSGNSGVQYRSKVKEETSWSVGGYQYEIDATGQWMTGELYEEGGQRHLPPVPGRPEPAFLAYLGEQVHFSLGGTRTVTGRLQTIARYRPGDWNDLTIICKGNRVIHQLNGVKTIDMIDDDSEFKATSGV